MVIPFNQRSGRAKQPGPDGQQGPTEVSAAETEGILVQIGLKVFLGQAMIGTQNKHFSVTDDNVQPVEQAGTGIVRSVRMGVAFQRQDVTAVAIAVDHTAIEKDSVGKFLYGRLLDIGRHPHFQKARVTPVI